mmetsp:Transcript_16420/g.24515  ORF Transcript_16420/g.24515 Transcript_16420/m.24515 type:complete len:202 (+) Transcript_16420:156-761(+)
MSQIDKETTHLFLWCPNVDALIKRSRGEQLGVWTPLKRLDTRLVKTPLAIDLATPSICLPANDRAVGTGRSKILAIWREGESGDFARVLFQHFVGLESITVDLKQVDMVVLATYSSEGSISVDRNTVWLKVGSHLGHILVALDESNTLHGHTNSHTVDGRNTTGWRVSGDGRSSFTVCHRDNTIRIVHGRTVEAVAIKRVL